MSSIALLRSLLLCMAVLPPLAAAQCPQRLDPAPPDSAHPEDWRFIEGLLDEREPGRLPQVLQRIEALRQQPATLPPSSERVALEIALDMQATLEWIAKRQAGAELPKFEYDYRDQHPHRPLQGAMVARGADRGGSRQFRLCPRRARRAAPLRAPRLQSGGRICAGAGFGASAA